MYTLYLYTYTYTYVYIYTHKVDLSILINQLTTGIVESTGDMGTSFVAHPLSFQSQRSRNGLKFSPKFDEAIPIPVMFLLSPSGSGSQI